MTPVEMTAAVQELCALKLPDLLATAGLANFDEYLNKSPLRSDDNELAVYILNDQNSTDQRSISLMVQVQLHSQDKIQEYHSLIMPFFTDELTPEVVGMVERESIDADVWPIDFNSANSFAYYTVHFTTELDDCREN